HGAHMLPSFDSRPRSLLSFLFNDPPPSEIYTLSLHDALPIYVVVGDDLALIDQLLHGRTVGGLELLAGRAARVLVHRQGGRGVRSEEHTSELQSLTNLVCRLLLEKKNKALPRMHTRLHVRNRS